MPRAIVFLLIFAAMLGGVCADEADLYRGQTSAQWLEQLSHPSASARAAAAQAFVMIGKGNEDAVEPLIGLLTDHDERVRFYSAYALGKLETHHQQCIKALTATLSDKDEHVRYNAEWSISEIAKQIANALDADALDTKGLVELLAEAETQLLAAGARPGHLKQIRGAIARFQQPTLNSIPPNAPILVKPIANDDIASCLQSLAAEDILTQAKAIEQLRKLGPACVEQLFASPDVIAKLGSVGWHLPKAIASCGEIDFGVLIRALANPDLDTSELAANTLREFGSSSSVVLPELIELLRSEESSSEFKQRIIDVIAEIGPAAVDAIDVLLLSLNDPEGDGDLQRRAAEALGAIGPRAKQAVPALLERLNDPNTSSYAKSGAGEALVRIDPKSEAVVAALIRAVESSEYIYDALDIAEPLADCESNAEALVPWLLNAIDETEEYQRVGVLRLLGEVGNSQIHEVGPRLFACLMNPTEDVVARVAAAKAIGALGPEALKPVIDELQFGDEANQLIAARTLVEIGSAARPAKEVLHDLLQESHAENELRSLAAVVLGQLGSEAIDTAPTLTRLLQDLESNGYLRSMCAVALGQVEASAVSVLDTMLEDAEAEVQIAAAYALCKRDPKHSLGLAKLVRWLDDDEYRGSAILALIDIGESSLPRVVERMNDATASRDTRIACLEVVSASGESAIEPLIQVLNDQDLAEDASYALRDRGNKMLAMLVASIDDEARFTPEAREIIGRVIEDMFDGFGEGGEEDIWSGGHVLVHREGSRLISRSANGGSMMTPPEAPRYEAMLLPPEPIENTDAAPVPEIAALEIGPESEFTESLSMPKGYKTVDVFYGTNRQPIEEASMASAGSSRWIWLVGIGVVVLVIVSLVGMYRRGSRRQATAGLAGTTLVLLLGLMLFVPAHLRPSIEKTGPRYGGEYSDRVEMGVCQVTIPDTHVEGELEAPTLLRLEVAEDLQKHIVLRTVKRMESAEFFGGLRKEMQSKGNNILVFVHGFNVSFDDAARRTAQMTHDLKFAGASVFYSWPSQADWWKYRVDEKNVELSVDQLKSFLLAIAERSDADTINLVAHSMGNRVLTAALKEIDVAASEREQMFNQVILAAPDIDADIFKQRIAPAIVTKAKHVTLYASSNDLALIASKTFNSGDPRAGDAGNNLVVYPGIETIDVTAGDSSLLGHSYYGSSVSVLRDIELLLRDQPASSRKFLAPILLQDDRTYWLFQPPRISRRGDDRHEMR